LVAYLVDGAGWDGWGGVMLNVFLAITSILLCFPLGVLAALGRRSKLPVIRWIATGYIELWRGMPLFVLLLMANVALGFFIPRDVSPGDVVRAIVVFTFFTGAYVAEIVRGGLQSLPPGQEEAAKAVGLSPISTTFLVVLPQALRNVIPALVGQLISLFKDTTLAGAAMGLFDLLRVGEVITQQGDFRGQLLLPETLAVVGLLFWVGSYTMSRESQRLERRLGVGER
jgi:general L-amino acid transport system permease protein